MGKPGVAGIVRNEGVSFIFKHVIEKEVNVELKNLKRKKAQGLDDFPPGMLKDAASLIAKPLTYVIDMSLSKGVIPTEWKAAKVTSLHKSESSTEIENYRLTSLLPTVSTFLSVLFTGSCQLILKEIAYLLTISLVFDKKYLLD